MRLLSKQDQRLERPRLAQRNMTGQSEATSVVSDSDRMKHEGQRESPRHTLILTFGLHQLLHYILLALVKRELARKVEAFFALHFDWLCGDDPKWGDGVEE